MVSPDGSPAPVELQVDGTTLCPVVELAEGSSARVTWVDLDTGATLGMGISPTLETEHVRRVGMHVISKQTPAFDQVWTLNLGFHRDDDYGELSLPSSYEHDPQPVTRLSGLHALTNLRRLCASRTPIGSLDLRDLSHLQHVECYGSEIRAIDVRGCAGLIRLCVENCRLSALDLAPVRTTLQDLRAAIQRSDSLTFAPLDGPMEALFHYCTREQQVIGSIPHDQLPVVEEYWVWATGQRSCDSPTSPLLRSYLARDNALDQTSVDAVLHGLADLVTNVAGRVDLSGQAPGGEASAAPSSDGLASAAELEARSWRVSTN